MELEDLDEIQIEELVRNAGRYLSYQEFERYNSDLAEIVNQHMFYKLCDGDTKEKNIRQLRKQYLQQPKQAFEDDLRSKRDLVRSMLAFTFKEEK